MNIDELVDNFALFDDWEDRYGYLVELGDTLDTMEDNLKTPQSQVEGCLSQVWMVVSRADNGAIRIIADSDAQIVRGLIAVLKVVFDGTTVSEAAQIDVEAVFERIGLHQHLSVNRRNGFFSMVNKLKSLIGQDT